jgi:LPS-assembly lipoprotein
LGVSLGLAGCVQPLYAPTTISTQGVSVREALASVDVPMIPDRLGHTLRNELVFLMEGRDSVGPKRYRLLIAASESVTATITTSATQRADSASVSGTANYRLLSIADNREIAAGTAISFATYNRNTQRFANLRAARDAQQRVARQLAEQIHIQIAAKLAPRG